MSRIPIIGVLLGLTTFNSLAFMTACFSQANPNFDPNLPHYVESVSFSNGNFVGNWNFETNLDQWAPYWNGQLSQSSEVAGKYGKQALKVVVSSAPQSLNGAHISFYREETGTFDQQFYDLLGKKVRFSAWVRSASGTMTIAIGIEGNGEEEYQVGTGWTKVSYVPIGHPTDLVLSDLQINEDVAFQATNSIQVGPNVEVKGGANVILKAGGDIHLDPELDATGESFQAISGATLDNPDLGPSAKPIPLIEHEPGAGLVPRLRCYVVLNNNETGTFYVDGVILETIENDDELYSMPDREPSISRSFHDGLMKPIQSQTLIGDQIVATTGVYDELGRSVVTPLPILVSGGFGYLTDLIDANFEPGDPIGGQIGSYYSSDTHPYSQIVYRKSLFGEIDQIFGVGSAWRTHNQMFAKGLEQDGSDYLVTSSVTDENGILTKSYSDGFGNNVKAVSDVGGLDEISTAYEYDEMDRLTKSIPPKADLDPNSPLVSLYEYNVLGWLLTKETPDAGLVENLYDKARNIVFSQDAKDREIDVGGGNHPFSVTYYDKLGRPLLAGVERDNVGAFSNLTVPDPSDVGVMPTGYGTESDEWRVRNYYDIDYLSDGSPNYCQGRLSKRETNWDDDLAAEVVEKFAYDVHGQISFRTILVDGLPEKTMSSDHSASGQLVKLAYQEGQSDQYNEWYEHDQMGRLVRTFGSAGSVRPLNSEVFHESYDAGGLTTRTVLGGNVQGVDYVYNTRGWLKSINSHELTPESDPGGDGLTGGANEGIKQDCFGITYGYADENMCGIGDGADEAWNGNIRWAIWKLPGVQTGGSDLVGYLYDYDNTNQLLSGAFKTHSGGCSWQSFAGLGETMSYDPDGNILSIVRKDENGSTVPGLSDYNYYSNTNRLKNTDGSGDDYGYDGSGNLLTDGPGNTTMTYNHQDLIVSLSQGSTTNEYFYDAGGDRVKKKVGNDPALVYIWGIAEYEGTDLKAFNTAYGKLLQSENGFQKLYLLRDLVGSVRVVVDEGGNVIDYSDYFPNGETLPSRSAMDDIAERFNGKKTDDESSYLYYGARYYNPTIGRWMSTDPSEQFHSSYSFSSNNPVAVVDPDGEFAFLVPVLAGAAIGAAFSAATYTAVSTTTNGFSLKGLGRAVLGGTIGGAVSGGLGAVGTSLGGLGQSFAFGVLSNSSGYLAASAALGDPITTGTVFGAIAGGVVSGLVPGYQAIGNAPGAVNYLGELGAGIVRGALVGAFTGGVASAVDRREAASGIIGGIKTGAVGGAATTGLTLVAIGRAEDIRSRVPKAANAIEELEKRVTSAGYSAGRYRPIYRSGGIYGWFHKNVLGSPGIALGRNLLVLDKRGWTYVHETVHYYQGLYHGYAGFLAKAAYEQWFMNDPYIVPGTMENVANRVATYFYYGY